MPVLRRAPLRVLLLLTAPLVVVATVVAPCAAQVEASLDAAASVVKYDGYLASGAVAVVPSVVWRSARTTLGARGAVLEAKEAAVVASWRDHDVQSSAPLQWRLTNVNRRL